MSSCRLSGGGRTDPARFVLGPSGGKGASTWRLFGRAWYLEELEWRFNNSDNPDIFPDTPRPFHTFYARLRGHRTAQAFPVTWNCRATDIPKNGKDKLPDHELMEKLDVPSHPALVSDPG